MPDLPDRVAPDRAASPKPHAGARPAADAPVALGVVGVLLPHRHAPPWQSNGLRWVAGLLLGVLFTWLSARSWPLDDLFGGTLTVGLDGRGAWTLLLRRAEHGGVLWSVRLTHVAAYLVLLFAIHWLRVLRWRPLLQPYEDVRVSVLNRVGAVGFMAVFLLPLRLGELARPLMLARSTGIGFGTGLGTIAIERVMDGLTVTLLLFAALIQVHPETLSRNPEVRVGAWVAFAVFTMALGGLAAMLVARDWTLRTTRAVLTPLSTKVAEKVAALAEAFVDGLVVLKSPWHLVQFVALTVVYWGVNGLGVWLLARGFEVHMPVIAGYAMMACIVVGMMIPNSPGNVGSFWYFLLLPAGLYGVRADAPRTVAFALAVWLLQTLQVSTFGAWGWWADARSRDDDDAEGDAPDAEEDGADEADDTEQRGNPDRLPENLKLPRIL
ncbi:MAG: flippase-like domain-containing protein [Myxococcales bacterium]|nr:flippase-like domain-containing protein [Myxococcales bacterium]